MTFLRGHSCPSPPCSPKGHLRPLTLPSVTVPPLQSPQGSAPSRLQQSNLYWNKVSRTQFKVRGQRGQDMHLKTLTRHQVSQTKATDKGSNKHPDTIQVLGTAFSISWNPSSPTQFQEIYNEPLLWQDFKQSCFFFFFSSKRIRIWMFSASPRNPEPFVSRWCYEQMYKSRSTIKQMISSLPAILTCLARFT